MSEFRRGFQGKGSTGYSPALGLVSGSGFTQHLKKPDGTLCCGRRLREESYVRRAKDYIEQWGTFGVCGNCLKRVGAYGPQRANGKPHLEECPAISGQPCICDAVPHPEWTLS